MKLTCPKCAREFEAGRSDAVCPVCGIPAILKLHDPLVSMLNRTARFQRQQRYNAT